MEILLERIKELCKSRSITVSKLEEILGLPSNTIYQWKKRVPGTERLQLVADYFHVSIDYLLGRTDTPSTNTDEQQKKLTIEEALKVVMGSDGKELTENDREVLQGIIEVYLNKK